MTNKSCGKCEYWQRDGVDGICFGGTPQPQIVEKDKQFVVMWPRTQANEFCSTFSLERGE